HIRMGRRCATNVAGGTLAFRCLRLTALIATRLRPIKRHLPRLLPLRVASCRHAGLRCGCPFPPLLPRYTMMLLTRDTCRRQTVQYARVLRLKTESAWRALTTPWPTFWSPREIPTRRFRGAVTPSKLLRAI